MTKNEFIAELSARLSGMPKSEIDKSVQYYSELIDDSVEDGKTEEQAVAALGDMDGIVRDTMCDMPLPALIKARVDDTKKKTGGSEWVWVLLVILGFPVWFPLIMSLLSVILSIYVTILSLIIAVIAVVVAFGAAGIAMLGGGIFLIFTGYLPLGLCLIGSGLIFAAVMMFMIKPVFLIIKGLIRLTGSAIRGIKSMFVKK